MRSLFLLLGIAFLLAAAYSEATSFAEYLFDHYRMHRMRDHALLDCRLVKRFVRRIYA